MKSVRIGRFSDLFSRRDTSYQSEYEKIRIMKTQNTDTFHAAIFFFSVCLFLFFSFVKAADFN